MSRQAPRIGPALTGEGVASVNSSMLSFYCSPRFKGGGASALRSLSEVLFGLDAGEAGRLFDDLYSSSSTSSNVISYTNDYIAGFS